MTYPHHSRGCDLDTDHRGYCRTKATHPYDFTVKNVEPVQFDEMGVIPIGELEGWAKAWDALNPNKPQPAPRPGSEAVWPLVLTDMIDRHVGGMKKYGTPLQTNNGRDALVDAYQEALDLAVYLRQAIEERKAA